VTPPAGTQITFADIDGDGRPDLVLLTVNGNSSNLAVYLNTSTSAGISFATTAAINHPLYLSGSTGVALYGDNYSSSAGYQQATSSLSRFDFNGDGRSDLVLTAYVSNQSFSGNFAYELAYNGTTFTETGGASLGTGTVPSPFVALNFNDDACTDLMGTNSLQISQCNGNAYLDVAIPSGTAALAVDWDGDGRTDILANVGGSFTLYRSEGYQLAAGVATGIAAGNGTWAVTDQNGDGLDDLAFVNIGTLALTYGLHNGAGVYADLANSFADAYGVAFKPSYASLTTISQTPGGEFGPDLKVRPLVGGHPSNTFPQQPFYGPLAVVTSTGSSDGIGNIYSTNYLYYYGTLNLQGRGFAGFQLTKTQDTRTGIVEEKSYWTDFPYVGLLVGDSVLTSTGNGISAYTASQAVLTLDATANNQRAFPYIQSSNTQTFEVSAAAPLITTLAANYTYDNYGNALTFSSTVTDADSTSPYFNDTWTNNTVNKVTVDTTTWCLNLPTETTVTNSSTAALGTAITRTIQYNNADYTNCRQTEKVVEPNSTLYKVTEDYGYDAFGNLNTDSVTGVGMATRVSKTQWTANGQFPQTITNALTQPFTQNYDPNNGNLLSQTDLNYTTANPLATNWKYDDFARRISESRPDGTSTTWSYNNCGTNGCVNANNKMTVTATVVNVGGTTQSVQNIYLDAFDRTLIMSSTLLSGAFDRHEMQYDNLGNIHMQGAPCTFVGCASYWTTNTYDLLNRLIESQRPISATNSTLQTTTIGYSGRTTTIKDSGNNTTTKINLATGPMARSIDAKGYYQNFGYDAFGSLLSVTDSAANVLLSATYAYGLRPFQTASSDMDSGAKSYTIDALGETTGYKDANGHSFSTSYDALSRPLIRTDLVGSPDLITTWTWGTSAAAYNIGKLASVTGKGATGTYSESTVYDSLSRVSTDTITIPGDSSYAYTKTYNPTTGLLDTLQYPESTSYQLKLQYAYANGLPKSITDFNATGTVFWLANTTNARGQVTQETLGNGVVVNRTFDAVTGWLGTIQAGIGGGTALQNAGFLYDTLGNVTQRQNSNLGLTENFYYDTDYRLDHSTLNGTVNLQMVYDTVGMGNIASRSDVAGGTSWTYDPVRKHAVTQAGTGGYSFGYDNNGNAQTRNGYSITWTSYNYPSGVNAMGESATFQYGPARQRWQMVYTGSIGTETTYYVGRLMEKVSNGGVTDFRHYIYASGEPVAIYSRTNNGTNTLRYILEDHQRSPKSILTSAATLDVAESFTAFGNRRSGETWSGAPSTADETAINGVTRQGFTWQTALGVSMGLNHMNGRIQDSITGRFLSPDPYVSDPGNTQNYNRYSYVNNNPLSNTDPSGFFSLGDLLNPFSNSNPLNPFGKVGRTIAFSGLTTSYAGFQFGQRQADSLLRDNTWLQPIAEVAACYWGGPSACAGASAYLTRLNGGSVDQALIAAGLSYLSSNVQLDTGYWATDALVRGAFAGDVLAIEGGNFWRGFEFAAAGSLAQSAYNYFTGGADPDFGPGRDLSRSIPKGEEGSAFYLPVDGYVPEDYWDANLFGNNSLTGSCFDQSAGCSRFFDKVPGLNAVALLHDSWVAQGSWNWTTMLPAAALTYSAFAGEYAVPLLSYRPH
jgi:RHS repeat-associated protein